MRLKVPLPVWAGNAGKPNLIKYHTVRNTPVMLDSELAEIYGVQTRECNQAIKRNLDRFPDEFRFQLTELEYYYSPLTRLNNILISLIKRSIVTFSISFC